MSEIQAVLSMLFFMAANGAVVYAAIRLAAVVPDILGEIRDALQDITAALEGDEPDDPDRDDLPEEPGNVTELRRQA